MAVHLIPKPDGMAQLANAKLCGIYFLWLGDEIVYVGQSKLIRERILQHIDEDVKLFNGLSFIECRRQDLNRKERLFIEALMPRYNACKIAKCARKGKPWIDGRPRFLGLSPAQLEWARQQFGAPQKIRVPRKKVRRWVHGVVTKWADTHPEQFLAAQAH